MEGIFTKVLSLFLKSVKNFFHSLLILDRNIVLKHKHLKTRLQEVLNAPSSPLPSPLCLLQKYPGDEREIARSETSLRSMLNQIYPFWGFSRVWKETARDAVQKSPVPSSG